MPQLPRFEGPVPNLADSPITTEDLSIYLDASALRIVAADFGELTPATDQALLALPQDYDSEVRLRRAKLELIADQQATVLIDTMYDLYHNASPFQQMPFLTIVQNSYNIGLEFALLPGHTSYSATIHESTALREITLDPETWIHANEPRQRFEYTPYAHETFRDAYGQQHGCPAIKTRIQLPEQQQPFTAKQQRSISLFELYWKQITPDIVNNHGLI